MLTDGGEYCMLLIDGSSVPTDCTGPDCGDEAIDGRLLLFNGEGDVIELSSTSILELELPLFVAETSIGSDTEVGAELIAAGASRAEDTFGGANGENVSLMESSWSIGLGIHSIVDGAQIPLISTSGTENVCRTERSTDSMVYPARYCLVSTTRHASEILAKGSVRLTSVPD